MHDHQKHNKITVQIQIKDKQKTNKTCINKEFPHKMLNITYTTIHKHNTIFIEIVSNYQYYIC